MPAETGLLTREQELTDLVDRLLAEGKPVGYDLETGYHGESRPKAATHPEENFISGFSFTNSVSWARYVPIAHDSGTNLDPEFAARAMWPLAKAGLLVAHGAKFELRCSSRWFAQHVPEAATCRGYFPVKCTLLEAHAEGIHRSVGLKQLTAEPKPLGFGHQMAEIMSLFPGGLTKREQDSIRFSVLDQHDPAVIDYACEDAIYALGHHFRRYYGAGGYPAITNPAHLQHLIYTVEMELLPIVAAMEDVGIRYDWPFYRAAAVEAKTFQEKMSAEISNDLSEMLGEPVALNIGSHKQLAAVLFDRLGLPVRRRSQKTGAPSTDKVALTPLAKQYPIVQKILHHNQIKRLRVNYLDTYPDRFSYADDGNTHPNLLQHGVPAGRFSADGPSYQNSPKRYHYELADGTTFDFNYRDGMTVPDGYYALGFDLAQAELRVIAGEAGETALIETFARGGDPHKLTAALMLGIALEEVTGEHRKIGKTLNFALVYQMSVEGLADRLGCTVEEADDLYRRYFAAYPRIKAWTESVVAQARRQHYLITKFGRRVPIWEFEDAMTALGEGNRKQARMKEGSAARLAGNAPVQGGAADYVKIAMIRTHKALDAAGLLERGVRLFMNIHDALEWMVPSTIDPGEVIRVLAPAVTFPVAGWPPMDADWHLWRRWGSVRDLRVHSDFSVSFSDQDAPPEPVNVDEDDDGPVLEPVILKEVVPDAPGLPANGRETPLVTRPPAEGPQKQVIVEVANMSQGEFARLLAYVREVPGPHLVAVRLPEGDVPLPGTWSLTPADEPQAALLVEGGCSVFYDGESPVDFREVATGITL